MLNMSEFVSDLPGFSMLLTSQQCEQNTHIRRRKLRTRHSPQITQLESWRVWGISPFPLSLRRLTAPASIQAIPQEARLCRKLTS